MSAEEAYNLSFNPEPAVLLTTEGYLMLKDENGFMNTHRNQDFCIDQ